MSATLRLISVFSNNAKPSIARIDLGGRASRRDGLAGEVGQEVGGGAGEGARVGQGVGDALAAQRGRARAPVVGREELALDAVLDRRGHRREHVALGQDVAARADLEVVPRRGPEVVVHGVEEGVAAELGLWWCVSIFLFGYTCS